MSLFSASHVAKWDKLTGVTDYRDLGNGIGDPGPAHSRTLVLSSRWLRSVHSHSRHLRTARAEMPDAEDECRDDSEEPGGSPVINESGNIAHDVLRPYHPDSTPADRLWLCVQKDSGHLFGLWRVNLVGLSSSTIFDFYRANHACQDTHLDLTLVPHHRPHYLVGC